MVFFGQMVIGSPGAGKTTYCHGMSQFASTLGRKCSIVNLDFANDRLPYKCDIDVRDLISLERVMEEFGLGPNGGLVYCMEYVLAHVSWLHERILELQARSHYIIFDCPGQVELYAHHTCVQDLLRSLKALDLRLCSVHLLDSFYCCEPATFISAALLVAATMLRLGLPHVNVLTKIDLLPLYGPMPFKLNFFTDMVDLMPLVRYLDAEVEGEDGRMSLGEGEGVETEEGEEEEEREEEKGGGAGVATPTLRAKLRTKFRRMSEQLCELVSDFGLISFLPMNVEDAGTVGRVLAACDRANGYSFASSETEARRNAATGSEGSLNHIFSLAAQDLETSYARSLEVLERYEP